jgi:hypothetical protein
MGEDYGVPLHAWNIEFFKLCVLDCGRLLRVDDMTLDRDRFDYARGSTVDFVGGNY